ncbi:MAG: heavy metal-associated domain-containing protein [Ignavibacteria bacterium]|jgi:copper chaperone CopZ
MKNIKLNLSLLLLPLMLIFLASSIKTESAVRYGNEKTIIALGSIMCGQCVTKVEKALKNVDGVIDVNVDLDSKQATVTFDNSVTSLEKLENAITKAGYDANDKKADTEAYDRLPGCCKGK